jgi:hypothetical protein
MAKPEYREGLEAREKFDEGMKTLFRVPKAPVKGDKSKPAAKPKKTSKD